MTGLPAASNRLISGTFYLRCNHFRPLHLPNFPIIFGDNTEDRLGHLKYLMLILAVGLSGQLLYTFFYSGSMIPCVGASGGICGVITYYALAFPRNKIGFMIRGGFFYRWITFPAWAGLFIFIFLQFLGIYLTRGRIDGGGIGYLAHLGGAAGGLGMILCERLKSTDKAESDSFSYDKPA